MNRTAVRVAIGVLGCWAGVSAQVRAETVDRIMAIVNDDVITEADVTSQVSALQEDAGAVGPNEADAAQVQRAVLERLIERRLLLQEAARRHVEVDGAQVVRRLEEMRSGFPSEETFRRSLVEAGLSEETLKQNIRDQLTVQRLIDQEVRAKLTVSPQEVAREVDAHPEEAKPGWRVRASHLLVRVGPHRSEAQARALIEDLRRRLAEGAEFAELARRYSEDSQAQDGGLMDWVAEGELMPELDRALFQLAPGGVSEPIQSRLGFHLLRMEERRSAANLSVLEAHGAVYNRLYQQKYHDTFDRWMAELKRGAYIEITEPGGVGG